MAKFTYQSRTAEDIKARANYRGGGFDTYIKPQHKMYKVRDGKNVVRFMPPTWPKAKHFGVTIWVNYGIGPDNQSYLSLSKMKDEKDPIAEAKALAVREGDEKLIKALSPTERMLVWLIDRQAPDDGVQWWGMPLTVERAVMTMSIDEDTGEISEIDHHETGRDFRFYKEGTGLLTKYPAEKMKLLAESPLGEDAGQADEWLEFVMANPLPDILNFYDYAHIAATFDGKARTEDDDTEPKRPAAKHPRQAVDEDEDDEETKPASRSAKPGNGGVKPPFDEDDEEEKVDKPAAKPLSIRERMAARQAVSKRPTVDEED